METIKLYELHAQPSSVALPFGIEKMKINSAEDARDIAMNFWGADIGIYESSFALFLNAGRRPIGYAKISQGGITSTVVDIRILLKYGIDMLAAELILFHNHPSGEVSPSEADKNLTMRLAKAVAAIDVRLVDHIVLAGGGEFYSFSEHGYL